MLVSRGHVDKPLVGMQISFQTWIHLKKLENNSEHVPVNIPGSAISCVLLKTLSARYCVSLRFEPDSDLHSGH